jgi:signal transduction histidine kinase
MSSKRPIVAVDPSRPSRDGGPGSPLAANHGRHAPDGAVVPRGQLDRTLRGATSQLRGMICRTTALHVRLDAGERDVGLADGELLGLCRSLVQNAAEALGTGGTIEVATAANDGDVWLVVDDDGPGFPSSLLPRVTDPLVTTHRHRPGAGMGLTEVAGLVRRAGGQLLLGARPGGGARVRIRLPALASVGTEATQPGGSATSNEPR